MSVIFDAMLVMNMREDEAIEALNRTLYEIDTQRHQQFARISMDYSGGSKAFCTYLYAAAFNHLIPGDVEEAIAAAPWRYPDGVIYVCDLGDYYSDYDHGPSLSAMAVDVLRAGMAAPSSKAGRNPAA